MALKLVINYQTRIFLVISIFTWIITFTFFTVQYTREREYKVQVLNARLQEINARIIGDIEKGEYLSEDYVRNLNCDKDLRVSLIDLDGNIIFDTNNFEGKVNHKERQEFKDAVTKGAGYTTIRQSESDNQDYFYSATLADGFVVRTSLPYNTALQDILSINSIYGYLIIAVTLILTIVAFFASRRISLNVENLRDFADCAEKGDISSFSTANFPKDELGEISGHIINLYKNQKHTAEERDKHMREAMFEESEKNRIKQQLTNNINHELKTPVHAIQACLETIVYSGNIMGETVKNQLLIKSYENIKRLSALLADVSVITRMSEAPDKIETSRINVAEILDSIVEEVSALYPQDKYMQIKTNVSEDLVINGSLSLIESIFRNLIVNSIMHSNGTFMIINGAKGVDGFLHFSHYDNGKGIDEEHLPKIFERFYRVDVGRSRATGGTGLGLSIVKNAILFHKGKIEVNNAPQGGLQFNFTLKQ